MFGVRLSSLFTSRWMAVLWAVLVILTAIQFVGTSDKDDSSATADAVTDQQKGAINSLF
ncbi:MULTISPECIES: hypothetical protein [unclassified Sphingobium]|uniref:hypothetical protein n=1 Tax=unclassified Sphingobium TaxID=2611147 RepID=UPI000A6F1F5F|nr:MULTISPECIES: hypothetical protein [Sphingomonadaceae]NML88567.1 hypothetical protein [Sphingobium sp. TB-6]